MLRVLVGSNEDDFDLLTAAEAKGKPVRDWVVPKDSAVEDAVLFFTRSRGFIGDGTIASESQPGEFGNKPSYRADVGAVRLFARPVPLEYIVQALPKWGWATYPRSYVTPTPSEGEDLLAAIRDFQARGGLASAPSMRSRVSADQRPVNLPVSMSDLARALNAAAGAFEIGRLQELRVRLHSLSRAPSYDLFRDKIQADYAFHIGGRKELQFNIGIEQDEEEGDVFRHGVAFSLEPSQTLPDIEPLVPKIARFNDYVRTHAEDFAGFQMWHFDEDGRSEDRPVGPISDGLIRSGVFVMLGRYVAKKDVDVDAILADFDRLLPLYVYVESKGGPSKPAQPREFKPGCPRFAETATVTTQGRTIDVALLHKQIQPILYEILCREAGAGNVRMEYPLDLGGQVDAAVRLDGPMTFYELKIAPTAQSCLRQAIGQLLEYGFWPSIERAAELIVVGEPPLEADGEAYLRFLRKRYGLPLWYRRIDVNRRALSPRS